MKNKSKLAKIHSPQKSEKPMEWFYMNSNMTSLSEIRILFDKSENISIEFWEEAGVLELTNQASDTSETLTFEQTPLDLGDAYSNDFLKAKQIQSLYFVTALPCFSSFSNQIMQQIVLEKGGFFCADTENFLPQIS